MLILKKLSFALLATILITSCVAKRKFIDSQIALSSSKQDSARLAARVNDLEANVRNLNQKIKELQDQNQQLVSNLSSVSNDAETTNNQLTKTQQQLQDQQKRAEQLQALIDQQKQITETLRKKMADALVGFNSNELTVSQKHGKVYVSLQENLLFPSGSAVVNTKGKEALSKLAEVLNVNPDISVNIEGHTDSIPIRGRYEDNWALSTARATSIVRILVNDYKVDPLRVIASGHSQFDPLEDNSTAEGRAKNRRTEIILSPRLDELYKLLGQQ